MKEKEWETIYLEINIQRFQTIEEEKRSGKAEQ